MNDETSPAHRPDLRPTHASTDAPLAGGDGTRAPSRFFEDFQVGETWVSPPVEVTEADILAFGRAYDPQPMHTDPVRAAEGPFGGLVASGWHIASLSVRVFVEAGGYGRTPVVGLGIDQLRWQQSVRAGDVLRFTREVEELRRSASNPSHGIVRTRVTARNQRDEVVMTLLTAGRVPARGGAAAAGAGEGRAR